MDITVLTAITVAVVAALLALFSLLHARRLGRAIDLALARIGGQPSRRWWRRSATLDTEVRTLEESVASAERDRSRLAAAVAEASTGILLTDDAGVVVFANEAAGSLLGANHGEVVSEARVHQAIEASILNRRIDHRQIEVFAPQRRHLDIRAVPLELGVESLGAVAYIEDITESRQTDVMRRDFVANVSSELRGPLETLAALAASLAAGSGITDPARATADQVGEEAQRLSAAVGSLLELSQVEAAERSSGPVELSAVMAAVAADFAQAAISKQVDLSITSMPGGTVVWGQQRSIQTMFGHLVDNAVNFTPAGSGERRPQIRVHATVAKQTVVVSVADEGTGMAEEHLSRVFERFYRIDGADIAQPRGTGLGLSIARRIARNHGGDIAVESQRGVGTTFRVSLPTWRQP